MLGHSIIIKKKKLSLSGQALWHQEGANRNTSKAAKTLTKNSGFSPKKSLHKKNELKTPNSSTWLKSHHGLSWSEKMSVSTMCMVQQEVLNVYLVGINRKSIWRYSVQNFPNFISSSLEISGIQI